MLAKIYISSFVWLIMGKDVSDKLVNEASSGKRDEARVYEMKPIITMEQVEYIAGIRLWLRHSADKSRYEKRFFARIPA